MPYVVVNVATRSDERIGIKLQNTLYGVRVVGFDDYPPADVRAHVQEGDRIVSVNGARVRDAHSAARHLRRANGSVSVCMLRAVA